jgi:hypothetical protein
MINPHSDEYIVRSGHWISEPGSYDLKVVRMKYSAPVGKNACYEVELITPDNLQSIQRIYLTEKSMKYFVNFLKTVSAEELPETIEETDEALIKEIAEAGYFRAQFLPEIYNEKTTYKIQWFQLERIDPVDWSLLIEKAMAEKPVEKTDDIPF